MPPAEASSALRCPPAPEAVVVAQEEITTLARTGTQLPAVLASELDLRRPQAWLREDLKD